MLDQPDQFPGPALGNGRDPAIFQPNPAARARIRAQFGLTQGRVVVKLRTDVAPQHAERLKQLATFLESSKGKQ